MDYIVSDNDLSTLSSIIRGKFGSSALLSWPNGFQNAVEQLVYPTGTLSITSNGTYDVSAYASASVDVSGGGGGSVETTAISLPYPTCYYTDGDMEMVTASVPQGVVSPVGTIAVGYGPGSPEASLSGVRRILSVTVNRQTYYVYEVTG